jgi:fumarylpyruvate hydrolase
MTSNLHHEIELVVAIGGGGKEIRSESALEHVWGYGVGFDMHCRDLQPQAKNLRRPWEMAKVLIN